MKTICVNSRSNIRVILHGSGSQSIAFQQCDPWENRAELPCSKLTTEDLFAYLKSVQDGCGDTGHGTNHASQAQIDEHKEEHYRPEGAGREVGHSLSESNESQTSALNRLEGGKKDVSSLHGR